MTKKRRKSIIPELWDAILGRCFECSDEDEARVIHCPNTDCRLYPYRFGKKHKRATENMLWGAIKAFCTKCSGDSRLNREQCGIDVCTLWKYRNGNKKEDKGESS